MLLNTQQDFATKASQLLSWGHWFTLLNIFAALLVSGIYLVADGVPQTALGNLYLVVYWVGHIGFLTFLSFVLTIFPISLVFPYPRHIRGVAAIIATFLLCVLMLDAYVYYKLGYHITFSAVDEIISLIWHTLSSSPALATFIAGSAILLVLFFELIASNYSWRHLAQLQSLRYKKAFAAVFIASFVLSHLLHIWADANVNLDITRQDNLLPLSYPTTAKSLLAKHGFIDLETYHQNSDITLATDAITFTPNTQLKACPLTGKRVQILIFNDELSLANFMSDKSNTQVYDNFYQPTENVEALFNLMYSLPSVYMPSIEAQQLHPNWLQAVPANLVDFNYQSQPQKEAVIQIAIVDKQPFAIDENALVFAFSLAGDNDDVFAKSPLYIRNYKFNSQTITTTQDLVPTALGYVATCDSQVENTMLGHDVFNSANATGINYSAKNFIAYKKDKITLINSSGNHQTISARSGFIIDDKLDVPFIVKSLKKIQQFQSNSTQTKP